MSKPNFLPMDLFDEYSECVLDLTSQSWALRILWREVIEDDRGVLTDQSQSILSCILETIFNDIQELAYLEPKL